MDNWLKFQYHRCLFERSGDAGGQVVPAAGIVGPSEVGSLVVKYARCSEGVMGRENRVPK